MTTKDDLIGDLVIMAVSKAMAASDALVTSLQKTVLDREAELAAIRNRINELFAGDYMPNQSAIEQAVFYPSNELVQRIREGLQQQGEE